MYSKGHFGLLERTLKGLYFDSLSLHSKCHFWPPWAYVQMVIFCVLELTLNGLFLTLQNIPTIFSQLCSTVWEWILLNPTPAEFMSYQLLYYKTALRGNFMKDPWLHKNIKKFHFGIKSPNLVGISSEIFRMIAIVGLMTYIWYDFLEFFKLYYFCFDVLQYTYFILKFLNKNYILQ